MSKTKWRISVSSAQVNDAADTLRAWSVLDPLDVICGVECVYVSAEVLTPTLNYLQLARPDIKVHALHACAR